MNASRKLAETPRTAARSARRAFTPECYDFDSDVASEALQEMQTRANVVLGSEEWVTIEGYVGDRKK